MLEQEANKNITPQANQIKVPTERYSLKLQLPSLIIITIILTREFLSTTIVKTIKMSMKKILLKLAELAL